MTACWHRPPGEDWRYIPAPGQPPTTACGPALDPALAAPPADEEFWRAAADQTSVRSREVADAIRAAQAACPAAWRGHCIVGGPPNIDAAYTLVAKHLQLQGVRASQAQERGGRLKDHLFVGAGDARRWEEWKLFAYADGCLAQTQFRGVHEYLGAAPTPPTPKPPVLPPPSSDACPIAPCPIRTWTKETLPPGWGDHEIGRPAYEVKAIPHTMGNGDGSVVVIRQEPFCAATGQSPSADGQPRAACPMRLPGSGKDAEQVAVEAWILFGGFTRDGRNGQDCTPNHTGNPAAFLGGTGKCRICSANLALRNDPRSCSEWF